MAPKKGAAPASASNAAPKTTTASQSAPVTILEPSLATYAHLVAMLAVFYVSLPSIIANPVLSMSSALLPTAGLQLFYTASAIHSPAAPPKKKKEAPGLSARIVPALLSLITSLAFGAPVLYLTLLLFGAPFTTLHAETWLCAAHLALLAGPPLVYVHGVESAAWLRVAALDVPVDEAFGAALGTLLGAWAGAIPIPLDWDREWQRWPVTVLAGAYAGWGVGKVVGGTVARGCRIRLD